MLTESILRRTGDLTTRVLLLALMSLALGAASYVIARSEAERAATAELYFNPDAAYHYNSALSHASHPAVEAAQSMLTDAVLLGVLRKAGDSSEDASAARDEFRSGIVFEERSLETLRVRFRDPDPRRAGAVANAVAMALEEWSPPATQLAVSAPVAAVPAALPAAVQAAPKQEDALAGAYSTLAQNEGRLAGIDERLEVLAGRTPSVPLHAAGLTAAQEDERRSLETQLAGEHQKLDDLRSEPGEDESASETAERTIASLQQELGAFPPSETRSGEAAASNDAQAAQLRQQRGRVSREIAAENRRIARLRAHPVQEPAEAPAAPAQVVAAPTVLAKRAGPEWQNPFRVARLARTTPRLLAQPVRLAGGVAGLFFAAGLGGLLLRRRGMQTAEQEESVYVLVPPMPVAQQDEGEAISQVAVQGSIATKAPNVRETVAEEPDDTWEAGAREPEDAAGVAATEVGESVAGEPVAEQRLLAFMSAAENPDDRLEPAHPIFAAKASLRGLEAPREPAHREEEAAEATRARLQQAVARRTAVPAPEAAPAAERSNGQPVESKISRSSIADPGENDAEWSERILGALTRTLVEKEARIREAKVNRTAKASADRAAESGEGQGAGDRKASGGGE